MDMCLQMIKFIQSNLFINNDVRMYHPESNTPALARTSNLNEELGQVNSSGPSSFGSLFCLVVVSVYFHLDQQHEGERQMCL